MEEIPREQTRRKNRPARVPCDFLDLFRHGEACRKNDAVRTVLEERLNSLQAFFPAEAFEIGAFRLSYNLDAMFGEMPEEASEGKTRTIHHGFYHRMIQSGIHDDTQLKPFPACLHKLAQCKSGRLALCLFGHFASVTFSCGPNPCGRRERCPCGP